MILTPAIIALMLGMLLALLMTLYASAIALRILLSWDIRSGSEEQLVLERQTYLISTMLTYVMGFELFSLFLYVYTVDHLHSLFIGAMCAAGTLNVNSYGYSTLLVKMIIFVLCGMWLILNHTDNCGFDYPLIRSKYRFLLVISGFILLEAFLQTRYFTEMHPNIITSCCGSLFSESSLGLAADMVGVPPRAAMLVFFLSVVVTLRVGAYFLLRSKAARLYAALSAWLLMVAIVSVISFISVYYYELPSHHCPFCLLQREYHYIGYPLYLSLFTAAITGMGVGMLERFRGTGSLREAIPRIQTRLCVASMVGFVLFAALSSYPILASDFRLLGY